MAFRVEQTAQADYDLDIILEWLLAQQAADAGLRWFRKLKEAINALAEMPERFMLAAEHSEFPFEVRQLLYGHKPHQHRVLFTIEADTVVFFIFGTAAAEPRRATLGTVCTFMKQFARKHHFPPQGYLAGFTEDGTRRGKLYVFDFQAGKGGFAYSGHITYRNDSRG